MVSTMDSAGILYRRHYAPINLSPTSGTSIKCGICKVMVSTVLGADPRFSVGRGVNFSGVGPRHKGVREIQAI